jgi:nitrogen fixation negative regulator NifL
MNKPLLAVVSLRRGLFRAGHSDVTPLAKRGRAVRAESLKSFLSRHGRAVGDMLGLTAFVIIAVTLANKWDLYEAVDRFLLRHRLHLLQIDEFEFAISLLGSAFGVFAFRRWRDAVCASTTQAMVAAKLRQRTDFLQLQQVIATSVNESETIEEALQAALDLVCAYTGWPVGHAYEVRQTNDKELVPLPVWHLADPNRYRAFQERSADSDRLGCGNVIAQVIEQARPIWIADIANEQGFERRETANAAGLRSMLAAPVWVGKEVVAVLEFFSDASVAPTQELLNTLSHVGTELGRVVERQRAAQDLARRERHYRALLDSITDNITLISADGITLYESPSVEKLQGYKPEELVGKNALDNIHPADLPKATELLQRSLGIPNFTASMEYRVRHKDGTWRHCETIGRNLLHDPAIGAILLSSRDITERRASEQRFRDLFENSPDAMFVEDEAGNVLDVNPAGCQLHRLTREQLVGKNVMELVPPDRRESVRNKMSMWFTGASIDAKGVSYTSDGRTVPVEIRGKRIDYSGRTAVLLQVRDVSEREALQEVLRQSEQKYRALVEQSPDAIVTVDEQWNIRFANSAACEMLGYTPDEILHCNILDTYEPEDRAEAVARWQQLAPAATLRFERRLRRKNGSHTTVEVILRRIDGGGYQGILRDISARRQAEETMRLQSTALEAAANAIVITTTEGVIRWVNPAFTHLTGYRAEEALGQHSRLLKSGQHSAEFYAELWQTILAGHVWRGELVNRRKDGSLYREDMTVTPVHDAHGQISHFVAVKQDITERKEAEKSLTLFRSLLDRANDAIEVVDPVTGQFLDVNETTWSSLGYTREEVLSRKVWDIDPHVTPARFANNIEKLRRAGSLSFEGAHRRKDGTTFPVEVSLRYVHLDRDYVLSVVRDITERTRMIRELTDSHQQLQRTIEQLQHAQDQVVQQERLRALGTMASGIAHDFNNSLTAILGFSELLLHQPDKLNDRDSVCRYLNLIHTSARDAANVVTRMRQFYRQREENELFAAVDLNRLVQETIELTRPRWKTETEVRSLDIQIRADLADVPLILGRAADLREALTNLIFNAVDAMPRGGTVTLRTRADGDAVCLEVADTGLGMTDEVRQRCLEPFFTTKGDRGTGLGLSMVYGIVQRHGGSIDIQTRLGVGTTFLLRLPARPVADAPAAAARKRAAPAMRVLVVDDEDSVRDILTELLTADRHTVITAANGREALEKLRASPLEVVLLDRAMPGMSGDQVAAAIKELRPDLPVIMLTGFGALMEADQECPPGVDFVLAKPVSIAGLRAALARAIGHKASKGCGSAHR